MSNTILCKETYRHRHYFINNIVKYLNVSITAYLPIYTNKVV